MLFRDTKCDKTYGMIDNTLRGICKKNTLECNQAFVLQRGEISRKKLKRRNLKQLNYN